MSTAWSPITLRKALMRVERFEPRDDFADYKFAGTYSFARGIFAGDRKLGSSFKLPKIQRVKTGDFVYCKIMAWEGAFGTVPLDADNCVMSGAFVAYVPNPTIVDPRFLDWYFRAPSNWQRIGRQSTGTNVRRQSLHPEQFEATEIPLPPLDEQRRIVVRIEELSAKVEEARRMREDAMAEAPLLIDAFLRERFAKLEQQYGVVALDDVLVDATYGTSEKSHSERAAGALPVLRIPNVASEKLDLTNLKYAALEDRAVASLAISDEDILIVRTNGSVDLVGRSAVVRGLVEPTLFASYLIRLRFDRSRLLSDFAQIGLRHLRRSGALVDFARTTAGQYNVSVGRLRGAALPIAPLPEQRRLIAELDALQAKINAVKALQNETAAELDAMLPAILDKAFKGELQ